MAISIQRPYEEEAFVVVGKPDVPHISHTQVSMFDECSLKWWFRYVHKLKKPQTIQILAGDIFHKMMAENFRQKVITGCDLDLDEVLDTYSAKFDTQILEKTIEIPVGKTTGDFKDAGLATLSYYMRNVAPPMVPRMVQLPGMEEPGPAVELELLKRIPETDIYFKGVIDLWEYEGPLVDYKVIGRKWDKKKVASSSHQAYAYGFLLGGPLPFKFHCCIRDAARPLMFPIQVEVSQPMISGYVHHVWDVLVHMDAVRSGEQEPRVSTGYCNEKLCSYCLEECKDWRFGLFNPENYRNRNDAPEGELVDEED